VADRNIIAQVLGLIPQQPPFRFIDDILEVDDKAIKAVYRFREDEYFYKGHFHGNPITPGVILIETMAQTGVVAMGIYQLLQQGFSIDELKQMTTLFAFADNIEFTGIVSPDEKVIISGEMVYLRKGTLKTNTCITRESGEKVCSGTLTGAGVKLERAEPRV
jgi:3-hydroxyacyl-[acyl-carrier-protein] dehydratase